MAWDFSQMLRLNFINLVWFHRCYDYRDQSDFSSPTCQGCKKNSGFSVKSVKCMGMSASAFPPVLFKMNTRFKRYTKNIFKMLFDEITMQFHRIFFHCSCGFSWFNFERVSICLCRVKLRQAKVFDPFKCHGWNQCEEEMLCDGLVECFTKRIFTFISLIFLSVIWICSTKRIYKCT